MPQNPNKQLRDIKFSVLDLVPILQGGSPSESFKNSLDLAQHAEKWGYHRYWVAEHHNMPGIASSATSVVIGYLGAGTKSIRLGSGGIMLPNHAPLVIAEQFGTLESMFPGRIDLGIGRAPGTDQTTARALRRDLMGSVEAFPANLHELREYFQPTQESRARLIHAVPGEGLNIAIWLLGSSGYSARLAADLGLPFAFASHFSPDYTLPAIKLYRDNFQPSDVLAEPYVMVGANVVAADTDDEAKFLATSQEQQFINLFRNNPSPLLPPVEDIKTQLLPHEIEAYEQRSRNAMVGSADTVKERLEAFLNETQADEVIISSQIYDHQARLHSYEIASQLR